MLRKLPRQGAKVRPSNSRVRRRRTSSPPQGPPRNQSVGGLRTLRILRISVSARIRGRKVQPRAPSVLLDRPSLAGSHSAVREVRRLNRFARGRPAAKGRVPERVHHTAFVTVPPRYCLTWSLFLHTSAGLNPARSVPGAQEAAVPAAGADCASHRSRASRPSPLLPFHAASHRLRRGLSARPSATSVIPSIQQMGRPGPGPGGRLSNPSAAGLCRGLGA